MSKKPRQWTEEQRRLIDTDGRGWPVLSRVAVLADAGSGKTSVLEERAKAIMAARPEDRLLCVSFTERSAADLKTRFADEPAAEVHTIHGFCARILRTHGAALRLPPLWRVLDETESADLLYASFVKVFRRAPPQSEDFSADQWLAAVQKCANGRHREGKPPVIEGRVAEAFITAVLADFDDVKERQCALEYGDLECKAAHLLADPRYQAQVRARYQHVFVDEFQDTSVVQCDLVRRLAGPAQSLFVVGDSKQSIYRFRGADVAVFEGFVEEMPTQQRLSLNFRSRPEIIDAVNATFAPVMRDYGAMKAAREPGGIVSRFEAPTEQHAAVIHGILNTLEQSGTPLSDTALLLPRLRGDAPGKMLARLRERGVGIALGSAGGAQQNPSLQALIRLWIWACEPRHEVVAAAAAVQLMGIDRGNIRQGLQNAEPPPGPLTCAELLAWLDDRFDLSTRLGIFYEQFRVFILNLQHQGLSPAACTRRFLKLLSEGRDFGGLSLLPPPANVAGSLRVLTVHASKGLEFPTVILADLEGRKAIDRDAFLLAQGRLHVPGRDEKGKLLKDEGHKIAGDHEKQGQLEENARLLYVAMTRAEERLFALDVKIEAKKDATDPPKKASKKTATSPEPRTWAEWLRPALPLAPLPEIPPSAKGVQSSRARVIAEGVPTVYRPARLGVTAFLGQLTEKKKPQHTAFSGMGKKKSGPSADIIGTDVHAFLESGDWEGLRTYGAKHQLNLAPFFSWLEQSEEGRLLFAASPGDVFVYPEFAFEHRMSGGETLVGRIDMLAVWPSRGQAWIVDYKVLLSKRDAAHLVEEYRRQLEIYADAVRELMGNADIKTFLVDVMASTGAVWHCVSG